MDCTTDLPVSTMSEYTGILVIVNWLANMALYLPSWKAINIPAQV